MADVRLLPCPMCGGMPVALVESSGGEYSVRVECSVCHVTTPRVVYARARPLYARDKLIELRLSEELAQARASAAAIWDRRPEQGPG